MQGESPGSKSESGCWVGDESTRIGLIRIFLDKESPFWNPPLDSFVGYLSGFCWKLKSLNLCGCVKAASDRALKAIGSNYNNLQSLILGWCDRVCDEGVKSLARGCPGLRALDLCGCVLITFCRINQEPLLQSISI
ncbi:coronatine-insensitive protein 1-like [Primulina tabacum]|uniref:coronatine-insensitive protein 1-like n=1 Tax=Primulina tabacum TaxID=48773 RepID=UPI003F5A85D6